MTDETATATETQPVTESSTAATTQPSDAVETSVLGGALEDGTQEEAPTETEAAPAAPVVPEKYELALEGFDIDPELAGAADPVFRELGLSNEAANKLLPVAQQIATRTQDALVQRLTDAASAQRKEWLDAYHADPEIGGTNREQTEQLAAKGLDALGFTEGHAFRKALTESGFGNHPDMIRAFRALGEMVSEDGTFARNGSGGSQPRPAWERLYPEDSK